MRGRDEQEAGGGMLKLARNLIGLLPASSTLPDDNNAAVFSFIRFQMSN